MKTLFLIVAWCLLFALLKAVLFLPARILGYRSGSVGRGA